MEQVIVSEPLNEKKKKRIDYVDTCKFIGIFLVTFGHVKEQGLDVNLIYSFHLPLFFTIAGFTLNVDMPFKDYLFSKIKSYLIPLFFLDLLSILVAVLFMLGTGHAAEVNLPYFFGHFSSMIEQKRYFALWFIPSLFVATLIAYPLCIIGKKHQWLTLIGALIALGFAIAYNYYRGERLAWNVDASLFGVFFLTIGYLFRWVVNKVPFLMKNRFRALLFGFASLAFGLLIAYICYQEYHLHLEMWSGQYKKYYLVIPSAVFGSIGMIFLSKAMTNPVFSELGKGSIVVLALQQDLGIKLWKNYIVPNWYTHINMLEKNSFDRFAYAFCGVAFTFVIAYLVYYLILFSPLAFMIHQKQKRLISRKEIQLDK